MAKFMKSGGCTVRTGTWKWMVLGAGMGAALATAIGEPYWIALGTSMGLAIGIGTDKTS